MKSLRSINYYSPKIVARCRLFQISRSSDDGGGSFWSKGEHEVRLHGRRHPRLEHGTGSRGD